jgi:hypothetical protein
MVGDGEDLVRLADLKSPSLDIDEGSRTGEVMEEVAVDV